MKPTGKIVSFIIKFSTAFADPDKKTRNMALNQRKAYHIITNQQYMTLIVSIQP
jgi:hypothetical protein